MVRIIFLSPYLIFVLPVGLTDKVISDKSVSFFFPSCGTIPPPVIMVQNVSFRYNDKTPMIYRNLEFGIDLDTRLGNFTFFSLLSLLEYNVFYVTPQHSLFLIFSSRWKEWRRYVTFWLSS